MNCGCENRKLSQELDRTRRLAKALAIMEDKTVAIYRREDSTYGFTAELDTENKIIEYISPY